MTPIILAYKSQQQSGPPVFISKAPPELTTRVQNTAVCQKNAIVRKNPQQMLALGSLGATLTHKAPVKRGLRWSYLRPW